MCETCKDKREVMLAIGVAGVLIPIPCPECSEQEGIEQIVLMEDGDFDRE